MVSDYCKLNLDNEKFKGLSKADKEAIQEEVDRRIQAAIRRSRAEDLAKEIDLELKDYELNLDIAMKVQKVNAYRNRMAQARALEYIQNHFDDPGEGLLALTLGSQKNAQGARRSVSTAAQVYQNLYQNKLRAMLVKDQLMAPFASGKFDLEIREYIRAKDAGESLSRFSDEARLIGDALQTVNKMILKDANANGALIGDRQGYVVRQSHDAYKIKKNKNEWFKFIRENTDEKLSHYGRHSTDDELLELWSEFVSGTHISQQAMGESDGSAFKGYSSLAKQLSKTRKIVFKNAQAEQEYAKLFGRGGLAADVFSNYNSIGRKIGIMSFMGPNFEMNLEKAVQTAQKEYNKAGTPEKTIKLGKDYSYVKSNGIPVLTGRANVAAHEIAASVETAVGTVQRLSLLGSSSIASLVGEPATHAIAMGSLDRSISSYFKGAGEFYKGLFRKVSTQEVQDLIADLSVQLNYQIDQMQLKLGQDYDPATRSEVFFNNIQNFFFKWTGQTYLDDHFRTSATIGLATRFGSKTDLPFDTLPDGYKNLMKLHDISAQDWDIIRKSVRDFENSKVLHAEGIADLQELDSFVQSKGLKVTDFNRRKVSRELTDKVRNMFLDQQGYSVISSDDRLRAALYGSTQRGTAGNIFMRQITLLKRWPMTYMQRVIGRQLNSSGSKAEVIAGLFPIMMAMTMSGYALVQLTELRKGREPKEFNELTLVESFIRGGGLGLYTDALYSLLTGYNTEKSMYEFLAGPTGGDIADILGVVKSAYNQDVDKVGSQTYNLIKSNTPFANHFMVKPVLDYLILNAAADYISPGSLSRTEQRMLDKYGNDYFMMRPSESMLFEFN